MTRAAVVMVALLATSCGWWKTNDKNYPEPPASTYTARTFNATILGTAEALPGAEVSNDFFKAAGTSPLIGRTFTEADYADGAQLVVILQHDFWKKRLDGMTRIIGSSLPIDGQRAVVIGVMPQGFRSPADAQIWTPRRTK